MKCACKFIPLFISVIVKLQITSPARPGQASQQPHQQYRAVDFSNLPVYFVILLNEYDCSMPACHAMPARSTVCHSVIFKRRFSFLCWMVRLTTLVETGDWDWEGDLPLDFVHSSRPSHCIEFESFFCAQWYLATPARHCWTAHSQDGTARQDIGQNNLRYKVNVNMIMWKNFEMPEMNLLYTYFKCKMSIYLGWICFRLRFVFLWVAVVQRQHSRVS